MKYVTYLRVSTTRQGESGLGLDAQRSAVALFAYSRGGEILHEFVEIEGGARRDRPELARSIRAAKAAGATLLIAKLDRLARSVALISGLMESGVDFVAADNPHATRLMLHLLAAFAEHERQEISTRTTAALAAAKARGAVLGKHGRFLAQQATSLALDLQAKYRNEIADALSGARSLREFAAGLNALGVPTPESGVWGPGNTARLLRRLGLAIGQKVPELAA